MDVSVFGLGYVGSVTAARLAREGHRVIGVDVDDAKVAALREGRASIVEPGLADLVRVEHEAGRLRAAASVLEAVCESEVALVCVGTPTGTGGGPDLSAVWRVGRDIGTSLRARGGRFTVVLRSTVLPGTTETVLGSALRLGAEDGARPARLAHNPEFLREGTALADFASPPFTLLGCEDEETAFLLRSLYASVEAPVVQTSIRVAEMVKYASNAFHALKICFANEVRELAAGLGVDGEEVMRVVRLDRKLNVSEAYLRPGFSFGGSCLPKDVRALVHVARRTGIASPVLEGILPSNALPVRRAVRAVLGTGMRKVGVLGMAFKSGTDDLRESPPVALIAALRRAGCDVRAFDPGVAPAALVGRNRLWARAAVPDLESVLCGSAEEVVAHAQVLVIGNVDPALAEAAARGANGRIVFDLSRGSPAGANGHEARAAAAAPGDGRRRGGDGRSRAGRADRAAADGERRRA